MHGAALRCVRRCVVLRPRRDVVWYLPADLPQADAGVMTRAAAAAAVDNMATPSTVSHPSPALQRQRRVSESSGITVASSGIGIQAAGTAIQDHAMVQDEQEGGEQGADEELLPAVHLRDKIDPHARLDTWPVGVGPDRVTLTASRRGEAIESDGCKMFSVEGQS